jgi:protease I
MNPDSDTMNISRREAVKTLAAAGALAPVAVSARSSGTAPADGKRPEVLIIVGDATETVDTLYPFYRLIEGGYQPVIAGQEKRVYQMVMHEVRPGWTITREWEGYQIEAEVTFAGIDPADYLGIFFSGGRAPEYIREDPDLIRITKYFFEQNKPIGCVCHGVEIPARAGCVRGRRMATVGKCKFDLEVCGGIFVDEPCVVDGNLVSGRTFHDHGHYMGAWMKILDQARDAG